MPWPWARGEREITVNTLLFFILYFRSADGTETVTLKDFSVESYMIMFRIIYGEWSALTQSRDFNILFQVYGLAQKYMLAAELENGVKKTIADLAVSPDTVVSALETVLHFKDLDGFEVLTQDLVKKVVGNITMDTVLPALQVVVRFEAEESFRGRTSYEGNHKIEH